MRTSSGLDNLRGAAPPSNPSALRLYTALLLRFALVVLGVTTLSRVFLGFQYLERLQAAQGWGYVLLQGLRFDLVLLGLLLIIPGVLLPWLLLSRRTADLGWRLTQLYLLAMVLVIGFLEFATPSFVSVPVRSVSSFSNTALTWIRFRRRSEPIRAL